MEKRIMNLAVAENRFIRIHDRYIILLADVDFDKNFTEVHVSNGHILPISKTYRNNLVENLEIF